MTMIRVFRMENLVYQSSIQYFENLEFRLNSRYGEDYDVPWLFLFVANVLTVSKRGTRGIKNIIINSNSNYEVVIINYDVIKILIIVGIPSILLFTL